MEKQIYTIALDKERKTTNGYYDDLEAVKPAIGIRWADCCTEEEALEKYKEIIHKQAAELGDNKSHDTWKAVRLYDGSGRQIRQES